MAAGESSGVAVNSKGHVFLFQRAKPMLAEYDEKGNFIQSIGEGLFAHPHGLRIDSDDNIWTTDDGNHLVLKLDTSGHVMLVLGRINTGAEANWLFNKPADVAFARNGDIYVADGYGNACVHKYSPEGRHLLSWGESGTAEGQFNIVHNVKIDRNGWVYVADRENHRIQVFSSDGRFETQWVNFSRAAALEIDTSGDRDIVYVGEYFAGIASNDTGTNLGPRVTVMSTDGKVLARVGTDPYGSQVGRFFAPHGIAVDSMGNLYVAEVAHSEYGRGWNVAHELRSMQKLVRVATA